MHRRNFFLGAASIAAVGVSGITKSQAKMDPPWVWTQKNSLADRMVKDADPSNGDIKKFPRCSYCGMSRKMWSHTRHLVQYEGDNAEGTCSIRCLTVALSLSLDRNPKHIWVGDAGSEAEIKPLIAVEAAHYALEQGKRGTMTATRKWAYADAAKAKTTGGKVVDFDAAIVAAYGDQARDTIAIRKRRAEKRAHMAKKMKSMKHDMKKDGHAH